VSARNIQCQASQDSQVRRSVVFSRPGEILVEDNVERPVQSILFAPMLAHDAKKFGRLGAARQQEVAFDLFVFVDKPYGSVVRRSWGRRARQPRPNNLSGDFLTPSPPCEQATTCQDQSRQSSTGDGGRERLWRQTARPFRRYQRPKTSDVPI
jgi:hypothetical protein